MLLEEEGLRSVDLRVCAAAMTSGVTVAIVGVCVYGIV